MLYEFYLPFPPSINNYYVKTSRGLFISEKGRKFRHLAAESIIEQIGLSQISVDTKLLVEVILYQPDNRKRDLDNYMKPLLDAITVSQCLWEDDSQIDQLFIYRGQRHSPSGSVYIKITEAAPPIPIGYRLPRD